MVCAEAYDFRKIFILRLWDMTHVRYRRGSREETLASNLKISHNPVLFLVFISLNKEFYITWYVGELMC